MASATESFCSRNQPFGFSHPKCAKKLRQDGLSSWTWHWPASPSSAAVGDCASADRRGWSHQAARGMEPPGFRDSQRLVVGYGNYWGGSVPLPVVRPWRRNYSLLSSMLSQVADGCAGTCIVLGFQRTVGSGSAWLNSTMPT